MVDLVAIGVQTALFAAVLAGFLLAIRLRMTKWVSLGFARMMKDLNKAAEKEGSGSASSPPNAGALSLGGFQITPELLQTGMQLLKMAQEMGFIKGGTLGGGGGGSGL